jgi:hypothetical protein
VTCPTHAEEASTRLGSVCALSQLAGIRVWVSHNFPYTSILISGKAEPYPSPAVTRMVQSWLAEKQAA